MVPEPIESEILPESVPVTMPVIPARLQIDTLEQLKALGDPTRNHILGIIQQQPATAKQIAEKLQMAPGTIGHHLQVLEAAGLAQVVARRLIRGIIAKYYTRTARLFIHKFSAEIAGDEPIEQSMLNRAGAELADSLAAGEGYQQVRTAAGPRSRIAVERAQTFDKRLKALVDEFANEPYDPDGQLYTLSVAFFKSPPYLQVTPPSTAAETSPQSNENEQ